MDLVTDMKRWIFIILLAGLSMQLPAFAQYIGSIQSQSYDHPDFTWLLLIFSALLVVSFSTAVILWCKNSSLFIEIEIRAKAQKQLRLLNKEMLKKAYTDELSGMGNRRAFFEKAEAKLKLAKLDKAPLAALMIDIDHFKNINDQYGHAQGDKVIQAFANVVLKSIRTEDVQGRIGGEEFALIAVNTNLEGATDLAERIRCAAEAVEVIHGKKIIKVSISIGIAVHKPCQDDLTSLIRRADDALYQAKKLGRNRVIINT